MTKSEFGLTVEALNAAVEESFPSIYDMGLRCDTLGEGSAVVRWTFDDTRLRPGGYIPGPTIFSAADMALWFAAFTLIGVEPMAVTSEMSIRFLRPAQGADLLARAVVNSSSARRIVGTIELWVDGASDRLVAVAQGTYAVPIQESEV